ncbi:Gx transporter family protein [Christensenellaceae bacterium OttesenSCG-928-L17]|nr:Gx transporter family protein [Christensenellaceae bacterium OttesenSCG-928-L17]
MKWTSAAIARLGVLTAVALVLGWLDRMLVISPVPGVKLGLANLVLLYAIYLMDTKSAVLLMLLKVGLTGLLFGSSAWTLLISFSGGVVSLATMLLFHRILREKVVLVSMLGAFAHTLGQLLIVVLFHMTPLAFVVSYLPVLALFAVGTGLLTGVVAKYSLRALSRTAQK